MLIIFNFKYFQYIKIKSLSIQKRNSFYRLAWLFLRKWVKTCLFPSKVQQHSSNDAIQCYDVIEVSLQRKEHWSAVLSHFAISNMRPFGIWELIIYIFSLIQNRLFTPILCVDLMTEHHVRWTQNELWLPNLIEGCVGFLTIETSVLWNDLFSFLHHFNFQILIFANGNCNSKEMYPW